MKKADLILKSNVIFTGTTDTTIKGAIAVSDNKIVAIGNDSEISEWIGPETQILEYGDELIMPGFNDSHVHLPNGSIILDDNFTVDISEYNTEEECVKAIKAYADQHPENEWIYGFGWYHLLWDNQELPSRYSLDKVLSDRPVCMLSADFHTVWVNSKALEICNVEAHAADYKEEIGRSKDGQLNGLLFDIGTYLVTSKVLDIPPARLQSIFTNFMEHAAGLGITSVADVAPVGINNAYECYKLLEDQGLLNVRIHVYPAAECDSSEIQKLKENFVSEKLRFSGLKEFVDGVSSVHTAYLLDPYTDDSSTNGYTVMPLGDLRRIILKASEEGFGIRLHATGDGAVRFVLDCFEEAQRKYGKRDLRHSIEHIENIHADDIKRFHELGIIASMQPRHCTFDIDGMIKVLGEERCKLSWTMKSLLKSGAVLSNGSDFPIVSLNPLQGVYAAVTRMTEDGYPENGWNPQEKLSVAEALKAYTYGSAYVENREDDLGTLEVGKLADIIVLSKDLFEIPPADILNTEVILTVMDGKIIYKG